MLNIIDSRKPNMKYMYSLDAGDIFCYHGNYYMKNNFSKDGKDMSINLLSGNMVLFNPDVEVEVVDATLTIKDKIILKEGIE